MHYLTTMNYIDIHTLVPVLKWITS